ncbi:MAG: DEAD/DEAH box helicase family protein [Nitrospirae bacterium]|nr:DEAD/DEAH box helicase family protein [Nitrospirota bacterium]
MFNAFRQYEKEYIDWIQGGYPETNIFTQDFIANLLEQDRKNRLWKHQEEAFLRTVYSYEILGRKNLLLNIVTGGGKTAIIAAVIAWLRSCHNIQSFLIMVPNLIVRDRLETDFKDKSVFRRFKLFPPGQEHLINTVDLHTLGERGGPQGMLESGIILGNIQQFYQHHITGQRNLAYIKRYIDNLAIFNDEAHNTPADEYTNILAHLSEKAKFRLDTTATPDRADGHRSSRGYTNTDSGEKRTIDEMDEEFEKIERGLTATQWVTDYDPMKKQIAVALNRLEEQRRRAKAVGENKYKPILFVVAICIKDAERAVKVLEDDFDLKGKVLLVTEDSADTVVGKKANGQPLTAREAAKEIGSFNSPYEAVVSVLMLREGWDVPEVSAILLLRKFSSPVYGQQVIGRGLRRNLRGTDEPEICAVIDHPKLKHDWLWELVRAKVRSDVGQAELFGDEDLPPKRKPQILIRPENLIDIPNPEGEEDVDLSDIEAMEDTTTDYPNWKGVIAGFSYDRSEIEITRVNLSGIKGIALDETRRIEIHTPPEVTSSEGSDEEDNGNLIEKLKWNVLDMGIALLYEAGIGSHERGYMYNVIMDHIRDKMFNGESAGFASKEDLKLALLKLPEISRNFSSLPGLVESIVRYRDVG